MAFIAYRASAGSGKTYTLTLEYLSLCLQQPRSDYFRRILAVTFTNKAANELRERIMVTLKSLGDGHADRQLKDTLAAKTGLDHYTIQQRALDIHLHMLYRYSSISISTIDAFTMRVLRSFAKELGLPMDLKPVLDHKQMAELLVKQLLDAFSHDRFIHDQLRDFALSSMEEDKAWKPHGILMESALELFKDESIPAREALAEMTESEIAEVLEGLDDQRRQLLNDIQAMMDSTRSLLQSKGLSYEQLFRGKTGPMAFLKHEKASDINGPRSRRSSWETFRSGQYTSRSAPKEVQAAAESIGEELTEAFETIDRNLRGIALIDVRRRLRMYLLMAQRLESLQRLLEETEGQTLLQSANHRISDIVRQGPAPFIYERVGERYLHYLIDEFQDTSRLQWGNMLPLLSEGLSKGFKSILVGDAKQSIYRWRNSEVEQIIQLPDIPGMDQDPLKKEHALQLRVAMEEPPILDKNYRSLPAIVQFNNALFDEMKELLVPDLKSAYDLAGQHAVRDQGQGYVKMIEWASEDEDGERTRISHALETMKDHVLEAIEAGYAPSDIVIIVKKNREAATISEFLQTLPEPIPVTSKEGLLLKQHAGVSRLIATLDVLHGEPVGRHLTFVLAQELEEVGAMAQYAEVIAKDRYDTEKLNEEVLRLLAGREKPIVPKDFIEFDLYASLEQLTRSLNISIEDPFIQKLLDMAWRFTQDDEGTAHRFIERWDKEWKEKASIDLPPDPSAVQVMTIHASKGLQFPVVIVPWVDWNNKKVGSALDWVEFEDTPIKYWPVKLTKSSDVDRIKALAEREEARYHMDQVNELYVALTRAEERLYVHYRPGERKGAAKDLVQHMAQWMDKRANETRIHIDGRLEPPQRPRKEEAERSSDTKKAIPRIKGREVLQTAVSPMDIDRTALDYGTMVHRCIQAAHEGRDWKSQMSHWSTIMELDDNLSERGIQDIEMSLKMEQEMVKAPWKGRSEVDLMDNEGKLFRLDRLYIDESSKRAWVIDYKTGTARAQDEAQIEKYRTSLRQLGYQEVKGTLIYTQEQKAVHL